MLIGAFFAGQKAVFEHAGGFSRTVFFPLIFIGGTGFWLFSLCLSIKREGKREMYRMYQTI